MSNPHEKSNGPFLALLFLAFLIAIVVLLGPNVKLLAAGYLPLGGGKSAVAVGGGWDPFTPVINGLDSFGQAIGRFLGNLFR